jgi:hypothetical protein
MKKSELQAIIREEIKNTLTELRPFPNPPAKFKSWKVTFKVEATYDGVKSPKKGHVETVKARNTAEAIRKAAKAVGLKGDAWALIDVDVVKK